MIYENLNFLKNWVKRLKITKLTFKGIFRDPMIQSRLFSTHIWFIAYSERTLPYINLTSVGLLQKQNSFDKVGRSFHFHFWISDAEALEITVQYLSLGVKEIEYLSYSKICDYSFNNKLDIACGAILSNIANILDNNYMFRQVTLKKKCRLWIARNEHGQFDILEMIWVIFIDPITRGKCRPTIQTVWMLYIRTCVHVLCCYAGM